MGFPNWVNEPIFRQRLKAHFNQHMTRPVLLLFGLFAFIVFGFFSSFSSLPWISLLSEINRIKKIRNKKAIVPPMGDSSDSLRTSVHKALGGGPVADVLLWRKWSGGALILVSSTTMWYLFEIAGYNFLSFVSNVFLLLVVILFMWAKSASLLNRPLPPIPNMEISEKTICVVADELQIWLNRVLSIAHDITIGRNFTLFVKVAIGLWLVSFIGSLFNFLTLVYIGVVLILSAPLIYKKFQHPIDEKTSVAHRIIQTQYRKIDEIVLTKLPLPSRKEKKTQ